MRLSICMMVKNEEKNLERCLKSLQPIRDVVDSELIIVDTGSEDRTVDISRQFTDKIYFHAWENDFSAMRNISINYATGEWIFIIDADEELESYQPMVDFLQSAQRKKYGVVAINAKNIVNTEDSHAYSSMIGFRLFKNDGYFHYEGAVHNQANFKGETLAMPEVCLLHYGYIANDKELMERKFLRTSTILKQELEKDPKNIYYWAQLSVTYAMHNDYSEAIECAEKAYSFLPKRTTPNFMFVLLQMILVYQHEDKYEKVAEICREALSIKEGYLDVYYYYAESQARLKNYREAIVYYEKYLELLAKREQMLERDITIIEYSLGCQQVVYSNLLRLYKHEEKNYEKALFYARQITDTHFIQSNIENIIYLYIVVSNSSGLRTFYDNQITDEYNTTFFDQLGKVLEQFGEKEKLEIAENFNSVNHYYGLLSKLILDDHNGCISEQTLEAVTEISLGDLPVYCSDIFYYLLKWQYPLDKFIKNFKETWINCAFDYINKRHNDLCEKVYTYLQSFVCGNNLNEYKLSKVLCRYALLLDKLSDDEHKSVFERYIQDGTAYMQEVYNEKVFADTLVHEIKNDEEVFLLYMHKARIQEENENLSAEYVNCLRKALQAFPAMKRGIEMLLQKIQDRENYEQNNEFEMYKQEIKNTIKQIIDNGNMAEAKTVLDEYKSIVSDDLESVLLESKILLN